MRAREDKLRKTSTLFAATAIALLMAVPSVAAERRTTPLTDGWRFVQADPEQAETATFDDSHWAAVSVPHDWAIAGPFDLQARAGGAGGFLPTGVAWYRKTLDIKPAPGRRMFVELDGVMERGGVWINGHHLGYRPNGYIGLRYDITDFLRADGANVLAVRADTSAAPSSRWYTGSGVYRNVRLIETGDLHVEQGGAFISTPTIAKDKAVARIQVDVTNSGAHAANAGLEIVVTGPDGKAVAKQTVTTVAIGVSRTQTLNAEIDIPSPRLWDLENPSLYKAVIRVIGQDGKISDDEIVSFGIRDAKFEAAYGFLAQRPQHQAQGRRDSRRWRRLRHGRAAGDVRAPAARADGFGRQRHPHRAPSLLARIPRSVRPARADRDERGVRHVERRQEPQRLSSVLHRLVVARRARFRASATATIPAW
jgi:beta-galactosidase